MKTAGTASAGSTPTAPTIVWLTPLDLCEYLKVSLQSVYYWRGSGTGPPAHKVGRHLRYDLAEVDAWAKSTAQRTA